MRGRLHEWLLLTVVMLAACGCATSNETEHNRQTTSLAAARVPSDATSHAAAQISSDDALAGLPGVFLYVYFPDNLNALGLREAVVEREVDARLRRAGVRVLRHDEMLRTPGMPSLDVNINGLVNAAGTSLIYNVRVSLSEKMKLQRPPHALVNTRMWNAATIGENPLDRLDGVYAVAYEVVDRFIAAWREANEG